METLDLNHGVLWFIHIFSTKTKTNCLKSRLSTVGVVFIVFLTNSSKPTMSGKYDLFSEGMHTHVLKIPLAPRNKNLPQTYIIGNLSAPKAMLIIYQIFTDISDEREGNKSHSILKNKAFTCCE